MRGAVALLVSALLVTSVAAAPAAGQSATYDGEIVLQGDQASDGTEYQYEVDNPSSVDNFSVDFEGVMHAQQRTVSLQTSSSTTETVDIGGSRSPTNSSVTADYVDQPMSTTESDAYTMSSSDDIHTKTISTNISTVNRLRINGSGSPTGWEINNYIVYIDGDEVGSGPLNATQPDVVLDGLNKSIGSTVDIKFIIQSTGGQGLDAYDWSSTTLESDGDPTGAEISTDSQTATLNDGETVPIDLSTGANNISISSDGEGYVAFDVSTTERTETRDPQITINGQTAGVSGTLADGETSSVSVDPSWIVEGTNNVSISTSSPSEGPGSLVGLDYRHETSGDPETITVDATEWEQLINSSKTFSDAQQDVSVEVLFADDVISVDDIEISRNGEPWETPSSWSMSDQTLSVAVGDVNSGDEIAVRAEGRRIQTEGGSVEILEPTVEGNSLDTKIRIDAPSEDFGIDTSGTSERIHYTAERSWSGSADYVEVDTAGDQIIRLPDASDGSTTRIRRAPLSMSTSDSTAAIQIDDPDRPAWTVSDQAGTPDSITVEWLDPDPDRTYELFSISDDRPVRTADESDGIVELSSDGRAASYRIQESTGGSGSAAVAVSGDSGSGDPLSIIALLVGLGGSLVGTLVVGRRFGVGSTRSRIAIGGVLGVVGIELATPRSLVSDLILGIQQSVDALVGPTLGGGAGTVVTGILILLGLEILRRRIGIPLWLLLVGGALTGIYVLDSISGGLLTGALDELGPLVWLLLIIGGGVLLYRVLQPRPIQIGGGSS